MRRSALHVQEGGAHYKDCPIQPVEYVHANGLGFLEGAIVKYVTRHRKKHGKQDLLKARHCIELLIELEYGGGRTSRTTRKRRKGQAGGSLQLNTAGFMKS